MTNFAYMKGKNLAQFNGITPVILSDAIAGEARDVALVHAAIAREVRARDRPFTKPVVMLSGGETTVTLRAKGGKRRTQRRIRARHGAGDRRQ